MKRNGNCYEVHGRMILDAEFPKGKLCHGTVWHNESGWHGHCWIENGDVVIDKSNGNNFILPTDFYYALGKVKDVKRYTQREAAIQMVRTKNFGPWEEPEILNSNSNL